MMKNQFQMSSHNVFAFTFFPPKMNTQTKVQRGKNFNVSERKFKEGTCSNIHITIITIIPCSLLIKAIMTRCFRFFFLIGIMMSTLHIRIHLKHFELLLYICDLTHPNDNFSTTLKYGINCFVNKYRDHTLWCRLWLLLIGLWLILRFLIFFVNFIWMWFLWEENKQTKVLLVILVWIFKK